MIEHRQPVRISAGEPRLALPEVPAWMTETPCSSTDPEAFFPMQGADTRAARAVCRACPVQLACLRYAIDENIHDGIWGGPSPRERNKIARKEGRR